MRFAAKSVSWPGSLNSVAFDSATEAESANRRAPAWMRWPVALVCIAYAAFALILLFDPDTGVPAAGSNFVPFQTIRIQIDHGFSKQLIENTLLLAPIGFTFRVWGTALRRAVVGLLMIAVLIEVAQEIVDRVTDIDDVILNTFGGFLGAMLGGAVLAIHARIAGWARSARVPPT